MNPFVATSNPFSPVSGIPGKYFARSETQDSLCSGQSPLTVLMQEGTEESAVMSCFELNKHWFKTGGNNLNDPVTRVSRFLPGQVSQKFYPCGMIPHEVDRSRFVYMIHSPPSSKVLQAKEMPTGQFKTTRVGGNLWLIDEKEGIKRYSEKIISAKNRAGLTESERRESEHEIQMLQRMECAAGVIQLLGSYSYQSDKKGSFKHVMVMPHYRQDLQTLLDGIKKSPFLGFKSLDLGFQRTLQRDLLIGLTEIHRRGCVHRDIKPANIFINATGAVIGDFGLAVDLIKDEERCRRMGGTLFYLAPEFIDVLEISPNPNLRTEEEADLVQKVTTPLIDIWSMGVVFYQMLDREKVGLGVDWLISRVQSSRVNRFMKPEDPNSFAYLVWNMLQVDPKNRITAEKALEQFLKITASPPANPLRPIFSESTAVIKFRMESSQRRRASTKQSVKSIAPQSVPAEAPPSEEEEESSQQNCFFCCF